MSAVTCYSKEDVRLAFFHAIKLGLNSLPTSSNTYANIGVVVAKILAGYGREHAINSTRDFAHSRNMARAPLLNSETIATIGRIGFGSLNQVALLREILFTPIAAFSACKGVINCARDEQTGKVGRIFGACLHAFNLTMEGLHIVSLLLPNQQPASNIEISDTSTHQLQLKGTATSKDPVNNIPLYSPTAETPIEGVCPNPDLHNQATILSISDTPSAQSSVSEWEAISYRSQLSLKMGNLQSLAISSKEIRGPFPTQSSILSEQATPSVEQPLEKIPDWDVLYNQQSRSFVDTSNKAMPPLSFKQSNTYTSATSEQYTLCPNPHYKNGTVAHTILSRSNQTGDSFPTQSSNFSEQVAPSVNRLPGKILKWDMSYGEQLQPPNSKTIPLPSFKELNRYTNATPGGELLCPNPYYEKGIVAQLPCTCACIARLGRLCFSYKYLKSPSISGTVNCFYALTKNKFDYLLTLGGPFNPINLLVFEGVKLFRQMIGSSG